MTFIAYILFFIIILMLFIVLMIKSLFRGHDLATNRRTTLILAEIIKKYKPNANNFYNLECAIVHFRCGLQKFFPILKFIQ